MSQWLKRSSLILIASSLVAAGCTQDSTSPVTTPATTPTVVRASGVAASFAGQSTYLVLFKGNRVPADLDDRVAALGGTVVFQHRAGIAVIDGLTASSAAALKGASDVTDMQPDATFQLDDAMEAQAAAGATAASAADPTAAYFYARQWNMRAIHADQAWAAGRLGSPGVTVAIIDTGIDYLYPDLVGRVDLSRSASLVPSDDALVDAYFPGRNHITDLYFHGTHVASTVVSNGDVVAGVTSKVTLIGAKVCSVQGNCSLGAIIGGVLWAADHGANIANMSLGGGFYKAASGPYVALYNRVFTYARQRGMLIVVAAGNDAEGMDHNGNVFDTQCSAPNVVCTAATGPTATDDIYVGPFYNVDAPAPYTNYGRSAVDVAAPGGSDYGYVWAACSQTSLVIPVCQTGTYIIGATGTSMAAPHASGVAALIAEDVGRSPALIKARLEQSADDLGQPGTDPFYGKGRVNAARAVGQ